MVRMYKGRDVLGCFSLPLTTSTGTHLLLLLPNLHHFNDFNDFTLHFIALYFYKFGSRYYPILPVIMPARGGKRLAAKQISMKKEASYT